MELKSDVVFLDSDGKKTSHTNGTLWIVMRNADLDRMPTPGTQTFCTPVSKDGMVTVWNRERRFTVG